MLKDVTSFDVIADTIASRLTDIFGTLAFGPPLFVEDGRFVVAVSYRTC